MHIANSVTITMPTTQAPISVCQCFVQTVPNIMILHLVHASTVAVIAYIVEIVNNAMYATVVQLILMVPAFHISSSSSIAIWVTNSQLNSH